MFETDKHILMEHLGILLTENITFHYQGVSQVTPKKEGNIESMCFIFDEKQNLSNR